QRERGSTEPSTATGDPSTRVKGSSLRAGTKMKDTIRRARGFTLIELLIVIALISILATMGVVQYRNSVQSARAATLRTALFGMCGASDRFLSHARRDRSVLRRQGEVPRITRCARQRWLHALDSARSDHEVDR